MAAASAAALLIARNHPSGSVSPSAEDCEVMRLLAKSIEAISRSATSWRLESPAAGSSGTYRGAFFFAIFFTFFAMAHAASARTAALRKISPNSCPTAVMPDSLAAIWRSRRLANSGQLAASQPEPGAGALEGACGPLPAASTKSPCTAAVAKVSKSAGLSAGVYSGRLA
jgi:hypothetical protein